jgi:signal transduction histidine kinase
VWIATASGVCHAIQSDLTCDARPYPGVLNAILEDGAGRVWVGTTSGLWSGDDRRFASESITALHETRDGVLLAGFSDGGIAVVGRGAARYGAGDGLPAGGAVVDIAEDREGSVWIATYNGGLGRLKPVRVTTYSTADGLPAKVVGSIVEDATGTVWAGTQCGPVSELRGGRFFPRFTEFTKNACAWVMWPARDGALWIGTRGAGLFRWFQGRMTHIGLVDGLSDLRIAGLFEDRDGVLWIGTELGGLHTYSQGRLSRSFGPADGVVAGYLASFAQDREGRVWIGSNANGLSVFERGRFRMLGTDESSPTRNIANLLVDSRGDLWVGSAAAGLFRRRRGRYEPFGEAQGLGDRLIAVLLEDLEGTLWVSTARGISRLTRAEIDAVADGRQSSLHPIILDRSDGMRNVEGSGGGLDPSGLRDHAGRLWFSTIDGIAVVEPSTFRVNRVAPPVLVESATAGGLNAWLGDGASLHIPAGTASIAISYTAFSFLAPAKVRFRYRLRGVDPDWQDVGARRTAFYSRLPPGRYTFEVLAANSDGLWSEAPAAVAVVVAPFIWERRSVQAAALLLLLAATALVVRQVSLRRARARVEQLEREQALDRERSRIAMDLHDDLGSRLTYIAMMADASSAPTDARIAETARDAVRTMDELVWVVNARNDTVEGFAYYLAQFAEEHIVAAGVRCRLVLPPMLPARGLRAEVRRHVYLACKEAVNNAVKHAHASEIRVAVRVDGATLVVEIADDGRGLPPAEVDPTGNGLKNYRERMSAAGGVVRIESAPGAGTHLEFHVPLDEEGT